MKGGHIMEILVSPIDVNETTNEPCGEFTVCIIRNHPDD